MISYIFLFFAISFYYYISNRTKDYLHPLAIGVLFWYFTAGIANIDSLYDANIQQKISLKTNVVIFISGVFFASTFLFSYKLNKFVFDCKRIYFSFYYKLFFNTLVFLALINFFVRFKSVLFNPPFLNAENVIDIKSIVPPALPIINLFDVLTPFLAVFCIFELFFSYKIGRFRKLFLLSFIVFSVIVSVLYKVSRGELLISVLALIYFYAISREFKFSFKYFSIFLSFLFSFLYLGVSRVSEESRVSSHFGDGFFSVILSQIYTYIAMNFQNLNALINSNFEQTYYWGGLKFILYPFFKNEYESNMIGFTDFNTDFFNAKTYIYYFVNDLGVLGAFLYSLVIGLFIQTFYNLSIKNIKYFVYIACLLKPIVFMFFGNYFFGDNILFLPYLFVLILIIMLRQVEFCK